MDFIMTEDEAQDILDECYALHAWMEPTIEPSNEIQILDERLLRFKHNFEEVKGDGNCVARSIADQVFGDQEKHADVREAGVARLIKYRHLYEPYYVPRRGRTYDQYVRRISRPGRNIDPFFTQGICDAYGVRIVELVSLEDYDIAEFVPTNKSVTDTIRLVSSKKHTDSMYLA